VKLFLAPHNDDEALFGAFTLIRECPLVVIVTDSWVQFNRGDGITADQRWEETKNATRILGCSAFRLGLRDDTLTEDAIASALLQFSRFDAVYAPALQGGHPHHDLVCAAARRVFPNVLYEYCTYGRGNKQSYANEGGRKIDPTPEERALKQLALAEYRSQFARSRHHFDAVRNRPEWLTP
jgi:LmbE family N-acetylglucosaminyl deacetylase